MTRSWSLALALAVAVLGSVACSTPPRSPSTSPRMEWIEVEPTIGTDTSGRPVAVVGASAGHIVRIESAQPLRIAERFDGTEGVVDVYRTIVPEHGVVLARASFGARAWLLPPGSSHVSVAHDRALGREGFEIEDRALAWADGPWLGGPLDNERFALFSRFDAVMAAEGRAPGDPAANAARRVIARRVAGVLRAPYSYPFFRTEVAGEGTGPTSVEVEGPAILRCEAATSGTNVSGRITERGHLRAMLERRNVERASVHFAPVPVPPGTHRYIVEQAGATRISCIRAQAVPRLGHGGDERGDLELALEACQRDDALCAVALGLAGRDEELARLSGAKPAVVAIARELLSADAYDGARTSALGRLAQATRDGTESALSSGWARATIESSVWSVTGDSAGATWTIAEQPAACKDAPKKGLPLLDARARLVEASPWRSAYAIRMAVEAPCDARDPIVLEVDGTQLRAEPSDRSVVWTIVVAKPKVTVKRIDAGPGDVRLMDSVDGAECFAHGARARAPRPASSSPSLTFAAGATPGIEVWSKAGASAIRVEVAGSSGEALELFARPSAEATVAIDEEGRRWLRAGRLSLPEWAARGVTVRGGEDVAVRSLERTLRSDEGGQRASADEPAERLDEAKLLELSRALRSAPAARKAQLHQERALLLARAGEVKAAREDAAAARELGAPGDPELLVRRSLRRSERTNVARAFGLDADFDEGASRCKKDASLPRARVAAIDSEARTGAPRFAPLLAARALEAGDPADPRLTSIEAHVLAGSRWREIREASVPRVARTNASRVDGPIAADGLLRVRALVGALSDSVTVTAQRPAAFTVGAVAARARVEGACVPRASSKATKESCPLELVVDGQTRPVSAGVDGAFMFALDAGARAVQLRMRPTAADWGASARVIFDRKVPGARLEPGLGWILETPETDRRFLVRAGKALEVTVDSPGLLRVAAWPEPGEPPTLVATTGDGERKVVLDGTWAIIPVVRPGVVRFVAKTGAVTADVAERVVDGSASLSPAEAGATSPASPTPPAPAPPLAFDSGRWRDAAQSEPLPPTGPTTWATLHVTGSVLTSNWREGASTNAPDTFAQQSLLVHRKLGTLGPWASLGALVRERAGDPSVGGRLSLFEQVAHLRIGAGTDVHAQKVEGRDATTVHPRAFIEYGWRALPSLTLFPRIGFDGYYTDLPVRPVGATQIDDDVYSPTRFVRRSLGHVQGMAWWTPYFESLFFMRVRGTVDLAAGDVASASARAGGLVSLGPVDVGAQLDATSFAATPGARSRGGVDIGPGAHVTSLFWLSRDSVAIEPGIGGSARAADGRWQAFASLAIVLGNGRGRRDFAPNELGFFDGFVGGAPWRGSASGQ